MKSSLHICGPTVALAVSAFVLSPAVAQPTPKAKQTNKPTCEIMCDGVCKQRVAAKIVNSYGMCLRNCTRQFRQEQKKCS